MLVETTRVTEFEYNFACTHKGVQLYFVMSPGKTIFAVLEPWMSPYSEFLTKFFNIYIIIITQPESWYSFTVPWRVEVWIDVKIQLHCGPQKMCQ